MKKSLLTRMCFFTMMISFFTPVETNAGCPSMTAWDTPSLEGRWDITIYMEGKRFPSWLEIWKSGSHALVAEFVGTSGSARPVSEINVSNANMSFTLPAQWEEGGKDISFEGSLQGDSLAGTMTSGDGKTYQWSAVHAPSLSRSTAPVWQSPVKLFDGASLKGWHATGANQWVAEKGILKSARSGSNLVTDQKFTDFKLHIEFRYPKGSNSGVYLRGRYEVQIEDNDASVPRKDRTGGVYGFIAPATRAVKGAGQWQTYDITLVGRMVTIVLNGKTVVCDQEIPGITGGALDSREGEPGPLLIQGDHGPIEYRNIIITPAKWRE